MSDGFIVTRGIIMILDPLGVCPCGNATPHRCACGDFWCSECLKDHTSALGGRCPKALALEQDQRGDTCGSIKRMSESPCCAE
jgi:hypothetical protein